MEQDDVGNLVILGRDVELPKLGEEVAVSDLVGNRVRLRGLFNVQDRFVADRYELKKPGTSRIEGRIDQIRDGGDSTLGLRVLGFDVVVTPAVRQRNSSLMDDMQVSLPLGLISSSTAAADFDDAFGDGIQIGANFQVGIQQDFTANARRNFELDRSNDRDVDSDDDRDDYTHRLRSRLTWYASDRVTAVVDGEHRLRRRDLGSPSAEHDSRSQVREAFVLIKDAFGGVDIIAGRQDFDDPREWLYDQSLDGIRLFKQTKNLNIEASLSTTVGLGNDRDKDARNSIIYVSNREGLRHYAAYAIHRDFRGDTDETQTHTGVRFIGPLTNTLTGWLDLSLLTGDRADRDVRAWGADTGVRWMLDKQSRTALTLSYAAGSGDDGGSTDGRFRQTGLQDNNGKLTGTTAIRYYGELFDPELSNIAIASFGIGRRFFGRNSIEVKAHQYRQRRASTRLTNTNFDRRPNGLDNDLGWEMDLVVGVRRFRNWELEFVGGYFKPGKALGSRDSAKMASLSVSYRY